LIVPCELDAGRAHAAEIGLSRGQLLEGGRKIEQRIGDHRHARSRDLIGDGPALAAPTSTSRGSGIRAEAEHLQYVAGAFDMDEEQLPP
jgi:hypothetical protein